MRKFKKIKRLGTFIPPNPNIVDRNKIIMTVDPLMKTIIYYFTGTENSLAASKDICANLGNWKLVSIASFAGTSSEENPARIREELSVLSTILGCSLIVAEFIRRLDLSRTGYCFCGSPWGFGISALHQLRQDYIFSQQQVSRCFVRCQDGEEFCAAPLSAKRIEAGKASCRRR